MTTRITPAGLQILASLDAPVAELHSRQFGILSEAEVKQLTAELEKLNGSEGSV